MSQFNNVPIGQIKVENRQRRSLKNIDILADSIKRLGLIHPIVIRPDNTLVAGERRLEACRSLGWHSIPTRLERGDEARVHAMELEENVKREDMTWQEQVLSIKAYHELRKSTEPKWDQEKTATALGLSRTVVSESILVAQSMDQPSVASAEKISVARALVRRAEERKQANVRADLGALPTSVPTVPRTTTPGPTERPSPTPARPPSPILTASFLDWAPTYTGPKFNLIHCDFPYGIDAGSDERGHSTLREKVGSYDDDEAIYWNLLACFGKHLDKFCDRSAHLIFWFSMEHYRATLNFLEHETPFTVDPFPLIWHKSDNAGLLPDPNRGPRRTYETAFFASRGDRKVVRAVASSYAGPTVRSDHMSEKPQAMLEHFFRMTVDGTSRVLDPTCGSGSSLRAARACGAESYLGLELNPDFADRARKRFNEEIRL